MAPKNKGFGSRGRSSKLKQPSGGSGKQKVTQDKPAPHTVPEQNQAIKETEQELGGDKD